MRWQHALLAAAAASCAVEAAPRSLQRILTRLRLTGQKALHVLTKGASTAAASRGRQLQTAPQLPGQCNFTYDSQDGFWAESQFEDANTDCMNTFFNCMNAGGVAGGYCQGLCSAQIDILESNCLDTFCAVSGTNLQPQQANFPAFDFRSAACYPDDCDSSTHDEVVATWRYRVCGPALYATADCAAIDMDCAYDISDNTVWIIVGSVVGFFVLLCLTAAAWWQCDKRRRGASLEDEQFLDDETGTGTGDYGQLEGSYPDEEALTSGAGDGQHYGDPAPVAPPPGIASGGATGYTYATRSTGTATGSATPSSAAAPVPARGNMQDRMMDADEDKL